MYELTSSEMCQVSAGISCIDYESWEKLQNQAIKHGLLFAGVTVPIVMAATYGFTDSIRYTIEVGAILAPYAVGFGYFKSPTWKAFSH